MDSAAEQAWNYTGDLNSGNNTSSFAERLEGCHHRI